MLAVVVQEGGYNTRTLGVNVRHFFRGLWEGEFRHRATSSKKRSSPEAAIKAQRES